MKPRRPPKPVYRRAKLRPTWWLARILARPPRVPAGEFRDGMWLYWRPVNRATQE
jgi:hypothetical protein